MLLREYWNIGDDEGLGISNTRWVTQTYTPKFGQKISRVRMKLYRDAVLEPGLVTLSLRATTVSKPSGVDIATAALNGNAFTTNTNGEWYEFVLGSQVQNFGGVLYSIVLRCAGSGSYPLRIRNKSSGGYSGQHGYSDDSGDTWTMSDTQDDMFETYSDDPVPGSIGFFVGGLGMNNLNLWGIKFDPVTNESVIYVAYTIGGMGFPIYSLAVANDGSVFIGTGSDWKVRKYTSNMVLDITWATNGVYTLSTVPFALAIDSQGFCAIAYEYASKKCVTLLNASGGFVWNSEASDVVNASDIGFDPDGNIIVVGQWSGTYRGFRLSRVDGSVINSYWYKVGTATGDTYGISIWPNGDVVIVQNTVYTNGSIKKFTVDGTDIWAELALIPGCMPYKLGHDTSDSLYVATTLQSNVSLQKVAANGSSILATYNTGATQRQCIVTPDNFVVCVGIQAVDADSGLGCFRVFSTALNRLSIIDINEGATLFAVVIKSVRISESFIQRFGGFPGLRNEGIRFA